MKKDKFASLIMLGAFSAGVASSSAVSAQSSDNFTSAVDMSIGSHENNDTRIDAENSSGGPENEAVSPEESDKENSKNKDYVFVNGEKGNGVGMVKGLTVAGVSASAVGGATFGISELLNLSGDNKEDRPITDPTTDDDDNKKDEPITNSTTDDDDNKIDEPTPDPNNDGVKDHKTKNTKFVVGGIFLLIVVLLIIFFLLKKFVLKKPNNAYDNINNRSIFSDDSMILNKK